MAAQQDSVRQYQLDTAIALAKNAIELDNQGQFDLAEQKYRDAINHMQTAHQLETDVAKKQQLMTMATSYVQRITEIQQQRSQRAVYQTVNPISPPAATQPDAQAINRRMTWSADPTAMDVPVLAQRAGSLNAAQMQKHLSATKPKSSLSRLSLPQHQDPSRSNSTPIMGTDVKKPDARSRSVSSPVKPSKMQSYNWALGTCVKQAWMLKLNGSVIRSNTVTSNIQKLTSKLTSKLKLKIFATKQWEKRFFRLVMVSDRATQTWCAARLEWYKGQGGFCDKYRDCAGMKAAFHPCAEFGLAVCCPDAKAVYLDAVTAQQQQAWRDKLNEIASRFTAHPPAGLDAKATQPAVLSSASSPGVLQQQLSGELDVSPAASTPSQPETPQTEDDVTPLVSLPPPSKPAFRKQTSWGVTDIPQLRRTLYRLSVDATQLRYPPLPLEKRTFATSNYTAMFKDARVPEDFAEFLSAAKLLLHAHGRHNDISQKEVSKFFKALELEARAKLETESNGSGDEDYGVAAEYMWTSLKRLRGREFCTILNSTIRADRAEEMMHAVMIIRGISGRCDSADDGKNFPQSCEVYRGGGFRNDLKSFFLQGTRYRVPGFLATATTKFNTEYFLHRIPAGLPRAFWTIQLDNRGKHDPKYRCPHAMFVHKTHAKGESEYLFAPFSLFTVVKAKWSFDPDKAHQITLRAAHKAAPDMDDLPLSPWS